MALGYIFFMGYDETAAWLVLLQQRPIRHVLFKQRRRCCCCCFPRKTISVIVVNGGSRHSHDGCDRSGYMQRWRGRRLLGGSSHEGFEEQISITHGCYRNFLRLDWLIPFSFFSCLQPSQRIHFFCLKGDEKWGADVFIPSLSLLPAWFDCCYGYQPTYLDCRRLEAISTFIVINDIIGGASSILPRTLLHFADADIIIRNTYPGSYAQLIQ